MTGVRRETLALCGKTFGRWTILSYIGTVAHGKDGRSRAVQVMARCACGTEAKVWLRSLKNGHSRSCGCLQKEIVREMRTRHGEAGGTGKSPTSLYHRWRGMMDRCYNQNDERFKYYGARGIKVHPDWHQFEAYREYINSLPLDLSIDRINNDGNYEPGNVRWATHHEQMENTVRSRPYVEKLPLDGEWVNGEWCPR